MTTATAVGLRPLLDAYRAALADATRGSGSRGRSVVVGAEVELERLDPLAVFAAARAQSIDAAAWIRPAEGSTILGIGAAMTFAGRGTDRLDGLRRRWHTLRSLAVGSPPRAFVGFSFDERARRERGPRWDGFPAVLLVLPRVLVEANGRRTVARAFGVVAEDADVDRETAALEAVLDALAKGTDPRRLSADRSNEIATATRAGDLPPQERWREAVAATRADVRAGRVEKAVLARAVRVRGPSSVERALSVLTTRFPTSTIFAVSRGEACFIGATPESLVRLSGGAVVVSCVAGTALRDDDPERDAARARDLATSDKERDEHDIVVRSVRAALAPLCDAVSASEPPRVVAHPNVWHLASEVRGRPRPGTDLLHLASALHPTPAVCGSPRDEARQILAEREPFERGWYAGALGWVDARGEGELSVALRSALVAGDEAWLFAGCGIVAGSDPDAELAESEAKLRPMLEALGAA